jgi:hypothetical protein
MEKPETPKQRGWSILRKAQFIGFLFGGLWTIAIHKLVLIFGIEGENNILQLMTAEWFSMFRLADWVSNVFGWPCGYGDMYSLMPWKFVCLAALTNAILFFIIGTFIGWLIQKLKTKS